MGWTAAQILDALDAGAACLTFPALDNGYVYLAATRLAAFRSRQDWAIVIEIFGYSPREGIPSIYVSTFGSDLRSRKPRRDFVGARAYDAYIAANPHSESVAFWPIEGDHWMEDCDFVARDANHVTMRGRSVTIPTRAECTEHGIELEEERLQIFELCRWLAAVDRDTVLATDDERRTNIPRDMREVLRLEEWHHPNVIGDERPSATETFRQLVEVVASGDPVHYHPMERPNTHWRNWPGGGSL